eukprot:TRINITY_DN4113_c0_g1_i2.p1 TRINITY_DN4113_c0_g1~~TRINITY_DN4113_c0_g1_i2.p1  ORF type:complete len:273 (-),score=50.75 TRINITY_DN4113_c0_g1_i2:596-1414(-)
MGPKKVIYLIRHGEADHNVVEGTETFTRRRDSSLIDPGLTATGFLQAEAARKELASKVAEHGDGDIGAVVSSPLRRALQTAEAAIMPLIGEATPALVYAALGEVLCDDIWNEPRAAHIVAGEWTQWQIASAKAETGASRYIEDDELTSSRAGELDTSETMVRRAEEMWRRLAEIEASVIAVASHKCFLKFFANRLSVAGCDVDHSNWVNGEVRRFELPAFDMKRMSFEDVGRSFPEESFHAWAGYGHRAKVVANNGGPRHDQWNEKDWRFVA